jgi:hypothetical protein
MRGRYLTTDAEIREPSTVHSLVTNENHPLWQYLYRYGHRLPFVSAAYGNATFQSASENKRYLIYVSMSGFLVREKTD